MRSGSLYVLENAVALKRDSLGMFLAVMATIEFPDLWHERLGHVNKQYLRWMALNGTVVGLPTNPRLSSGVCEPCGIHKATRVPLPKKSSRRADEVLFRLFVDLMGAFRATRSGYKYVLTIVDDYSRYVTLFLLKFKEDAEENLRAYITENENFHGKTVKILRSDTGGEFMSTEFKVYLREKGIKRERTTAGTSEQNGVVERAQRTLQGATRTMLGGAKLSYGFWGEAVNTAAYLKNRTITKALPLSKTPYEVFYGTKPDVSHLRVFGCTAYACVDRQHKLANTAVKTRMMGYASEQKAYRLWDPVGRKVIISRDVRFDEADRHGLATDQVDDSDSKDKDPSFLSPIALELDAASDADCINAGDPEPVSADEDDLVAVNPGQSQPNLNLPEGVPVPATVLSSPLPLPDPELFDEDLGSSSSDDDTTTVPRRSERLRTSWTLPPEMGQ